MILFLDTENNKNRTTNEICMLNGLRTVLDRVDDCRLSCNGALPFFPCSVASVIKRSNSHTRRTFARNFLVRVSVRVGSWTRPVRLAPLLHRRRFFMIARLRYFHQICPKTPRNYTNCKGLFSVLTLSLCELSKCSVQTARRIQLASYPVVLK